MSYILDALKKSEQERGHGNIPDVQTVHSSSLNYRDDKKAYWPYILITAVILNLLAISYFIISKENPAETTTTLQQELAAVTAETGKQRPVEEIESPAISTTAVSTIKQAEISEAIADVASPAENIQPVSVEPVAEAVETNTQAPANTIPETSVSENNKAKKYSANTVSSTANDVIDFHELPESIKQQLPAIVISAHVYSSNPQQRSIVVNNNFLEQGEYVLDDLTLHEITRDGAIFDYQGTLFNYGVVSGWQ